MEYSKLGRTGLDVSRVCLGTMTWGQQNTEAEGHAQMDYALEQGVNFFDTAEVYSIPIRAETQGSTERIVGSWFKLKQEIVTRLFWPQKLWALDLNGYSGGGPINGRWRARKLLIRRLERLTNRLCRCLSIALA